MLHKKAVVAWEQYIFIHANMQIYVIKESWHLRDQVKGLKHKYQILFLHFSLQIQSLQYPMISTSLINQTKQ